MRSVTSSTIVPALRKLDYVSYAQAVRLGQSVQTQTTSLKSQNLFRQVAGVMKMSPHQGGFSLPLAETTFVIGSVINPHQQQEASNLVSGDCLQICSQQACQTVQIARDGH
jgi:hypothetical protein